MGKERWGSLTSSDELLELYLATEIYFLNAEGETCKTGTFTESAGQSGQTVMSVVDSTYVDAWVITANNPRSQQIEETANLAYNLALGWDLAREGFATELVTCSSPDGTWSEDSFLVFGKTEQESQRLARVIRDLAVKYGQNAVFRFVGQEQQIVPVLDLRTQGARRYSVQRV